MNLRNIAIIAHVDHGKTTLVDMLLKQSQTLGNREVLAERALDSGDIERERGITILAKNTAIRWNAYHINIIDTPGHADFGGEVERVLSMVDSVLLLVDAVDGPMPQTRFVTQKAFKIGFNPIVIINKVDRDGARPDWVLDQTFDLFDRLGATEEQLDFPVVYTSAIHGIAGMDVDAMAPDMTPLFQTIVEHVPSPDVEIDGPFQMRISALDYNSYVGLIGIGRIQRGCVTTGKSVTVIDPEGTTRSGKIQQVMQFMGMKRLPVEQSCAGEIVTISGLEPLEISDTLCDPKHLDPLPPLTVDHPTVTITMEVNTSPFSGQSGRYLTSRQIRERLFQECRVDMALRVEETQDETKFRVSGRGELHLSILIETMRREGYELGISRPEAIRKMIDGEEREPYLQLSVDLEEQHQGAVMEALGQRKGELLDISVNTQGRVRMDYQITARGVIGFLTEYRSITSGTGLMTHVFHHYGPIVQGLDNRRKRGALIAKYPGKALGFSLFNLQERGDLFISPGEEVYAGMIIGVHQRGNDLVVNPIKGKQLTNIRAAGSDENILLTPPIVMSLEQTLAFIADDELLEVTPDHLRIRKKFLVEHERKRASRDKNI